MAANAVNYQVIGPNDVYLGRTPGEWMSEFMGWLFSINPDQHNSGPVVFLKPFPYERTPDYPVRNEPNLMIGKDKLQIFTDQPIMIPVLLSYWATNDPNETETMMRERIRSDMINSDELRKDQITIDGNSIELDEDIKDYLIESPLFTLSVPEDEYTKSVANMVDWPVMPGVNQSVATAYIFIVKFPNEGLHIIHSYARGHTTEKGPYEEEFLYEIQVSDSNLRSREPQRGALSITVTNLLLAEFNKRHKERELTDEEHVKLTQIIKQSRERNDKTVLNAVQVLKKLREIKPEKYDEFKSKITEFSDQKP